MARIISIATDVPDQRRSAALAVRASGPDRLDIRTALDVRPLRDDRVEQRHTASGVTALDTPGRAKQRYDRYVQTCIELAERVAREAIAQAGLTPREVDSIINVSCTGRMVPSLDAHLINRMNMSSFTRRTPIHAMGSVGGTAGLARALEQLAAYPQSNVLLLSVELPSLSFRSADTRSAGPDSSPTFADGASGVVMSTRGRRPSPRLLDSRTYTMQDAVVENGDDLDGHDLHGVWSENFPFLIRETLGSQVEALLRKHGLTRSDIKWCALQPAGPDLLRLVAEELEFSRDALAASWKILEEYGNMASAAVLFVLAEMLENPPARDGDLGLIMAFGIGIGGEIVLARWEQ